jgi:hypothetical protein
MLLTETIQDIIVVRFENVNRFNALIAESVKEQLKQFYEQPHTKLILNLDVMELFKLLKLHNVFEIYNTLDDCVSSF